jgi:uncharacterized low-complexity protein
VALGAAIVVLVGHDGTPAWQLCRVGGIVAVTAVAVRGTRTTTGGQRAMIAYLVRLVGTAAGVGIGAGHLAGRSVDVVAVAGVLCLVCRLRAARGRCGEHGPGTGRRMACTCRRGNSSCGVSPRLPHLARVLRDERSSYCDRINNARDI